MASDDPTGSFKTHAGYIHSLAYLCGYTMLKRDPAVSAALAARVRVEPRYAAAAVREGFDGDQSRRSLNAAWGSELLLAATGHVALQRQVIA